MRRLIAWLGRFAAALLFRRVEVVGRNRYPRNRPVLLVANHFNGFVDPVLVTAALGRTPRFVAKATLAGVPLAGWVLRRIGVVFVRRRVDAPSGQVDNDDAFVECHRALADGDVVAIFPEGTTHDRPQLDPLRTGAARIALGARDAGIHDLVIVPVGLTFADKIALRSKALVQFGGPIELDGCQDARALTARIDAGLRDVTLDFPDVETAIALELAAQIRLSSTAVPDPRLALRYDLARRLGRAAPDAQTRVRSVVGRYTALLAGLRLTDVDVIAPTNPTRLLRSAVGIAVLVVVLGGVVAATALVNLVPAALVVLVSLLVHTPVSKGTVRVLVGLVAFPTFWITAAVLAADGWLVIVSVLTFALGAVAAIWLVERAMALARMLLRWQAQRERIAMIRMAADLRAEVQVEVEAVAG